MTTSKQFTDMLNDPKRETDEVLGEILAGFDKRIADINGGLLNVRGYKDEVRQMLEKHHSERIGLEKNIEENMGAFQEHANKLLGAIEQHIRGLHQGLNRAEGRTNAFWNTLNTFVRFYEKVTTQQIVSPSTREEYIAALTACGEELYNEAMAHEKTEMARVKAQQAAGEKPEQMTAGPESPAETIVNLHDQLVQRAKADRQHLSSVPLPEGEEQPNG